MAKKENREGVALQCTVCKNINYLTSKNKKNVQDVIKLLYTKKERRNNLCLILMI